MSKIIDYIICTGYSAEDVQKEVRRLITKENAQPYGELKMMMRLDDPYFSQAVVEYEKGPELPKEKQVCPECGGKQESGSCYNSGCSMCDLPF